MCESAEMTRYPLMMWLLSDRRTASVPEATGAEHRLLEAPVSGIIVTTMSVLRATAAPVGGL